MNLVSLLLDRAAIHPNRIALVDRKQGHDREVTYAELAKRVAAGAANLHVMGLRRGQTILVFQPVSIELYEILLAAFHAGLTVMLADPSAGKKFLSLCCKRRLPDAFFGSWKAQFLRWLVPEIRWLTPALCSDGCFPRTHRWQTSHEPSSIVEVTAEEPALMTFTSGSTGVPKAAIRTHGFLLAQHQALAHALNLKEAEVDLITLPVFVLANLASGLTSVLAATNLAQPSSPDATAISEQCLKYAVTRCAASPAFFEGLLKSPIGVPSFQKVFTGGAPVFLDLLERLAAALPNAEVHSVYGSTEAEPIAHFSAVNTTAQIAAMTAYGGGLCAGKSIPEIHLKIIEDHWGEPLGPFTHASLNALEVEIGQVGEIIVSGQHVLPGYLGGLGDEVSKIRCETEVWHRTGDAGWIDPAGQLWLMGRCAEKLAVNHSRPNLPIAALRYPFAIECALRMQFPLMRMAILQSGERRLLVIETATRLSQREAIIEHSRPFGVDEVIEIAKLPLDARHQAKIDYPALRRLLKLS